MSPDLVNVLKVAAGAGVTTTLCLAAPWAGEAIAHLIRRPAAQPQTAGVRTAVPVTAPAEENPMANWFTKYLIGPVVALFTGAAESSNPQVVAAKQTLTAVAQTDLGAVNPLLDDLTQGIETLVGGFLAKAGPLGLAAEIPAELILSVAGGVAKQAIDHSLGISPLPSTSAQANTAAQPLTFTAAAEVQSGGTATAAEPRAGSVSS